MTEIDVGELQEFIWHLHDETRWPAKYYKAVIHYCLDKAKIKEDDIEVIIVEDLPARVSQFIEKGDKDEE